MDSDFLQSLLSETVFISSVLLMFYTCLFFFVSLAYGRVLMQLPLCNILGGAYGMQIGSSEVTFTKNPYEDGYNAYVV
jgi:hypothetical protein